MKADLTVSQLAELQHISRWRSGASVDVTTNAANPRVAHSLVRSGHLTSYRNSDQIRGERRYYWWTFELTEKGRKALEGRHGE